MRWFCTASRGKIFRLEEERIATSAASITDTLYQRIDILNCMSEHFLPTVNY